MPSEASEQASREAELIRHAADLIVELGTDGRIVYLSDAALPILGRPPASIAGRSFLELVVAADRDELLASFHKVLTTGAEPLVNFRVARIDGLRVQFEASVRTFENRHGERRVVVVARDVTQRSAELAVARERDAYYRVLVESKTRPAAILGSDGAVIFSNQSFKASFGHESNVDGLFRRLSDRSRLALETAWFESKRAAPQGSGAVDFEYTRDDGETCWYASTWEAFRSDDGHRLFAVQYEDITQRKNIEFAFRSLLRGIDEAAPEPERLSQDFERVARALELDRLVMGSPREDDPDLLDVVMAWCQGSFVDLDPLELGELPDAAVARGDARIFPTGVASLIPSVADRIGHDIESFAGMPLHGADGQRIGVLCGYSRKAITDPDRTRALLSGLAPRAARTLERELRGSQRATPLVLADSSDSSHDTSDASDASDAFEETRRELTGQVFGRVIQQVPDPILVCEADSMLLRFANEPAARRLAAILHEEVDAGRPEDLAGHAFYELLPPEEAHRVRAEILPRLTPDCPWSGEIQLLGLDPPGLVSAEAICFALPAGPDSTPDYVGLFLRDPEARRSAEEVLRESELRMNQAQKMEAVGRLAGGIAHDFNNLLTAIIGYSDLVLDALGEGHVAQPDAEEILRAAERAGGLTRQLLSFSRRQALQPEPVDLNAVVADIDRMMRRLIGENIELVTVQAGELRPIVADPGQLEQVIVNLVVNARDAMPHGGRLELETANHHALAPRRTDSGVLETGEYVQLCVSDTGLGMDEETRAHIFEPFFTTKEVDQGTGLGLASVYRIVSQSGGQIDVESRPGSGTRFSVFFPVAAQSASPGDGRPKAAPRGGDETILLVEDAAPVRRLVQRTLEKAGYKVLPAGSATAALRHCARYQGSIDLLLTDVVLPKIGGPEIASRARELRPGIRVIFMSGFSDDTLTQHGLTARSEALLEKPFTPAAVLERVRRRLDAEL